MNTQLTTCDFHTAGHPFRIVETGYPTLVGDTILEKRSYVQKNFDQYRKLLINEPRGHSGMYGAILTKPVNSEAHLGVIFMHNEGYSTMCGHGTIALGRYAVDMNLVPRTLPETEVVLDCPCGIVRAYVECTSLESGRTRFHSVPSFAYMLDVELDVADLGKVIFDISYGGAFYAIVKVSQLRMDLHKTPLTVLAETAYKITEATKEKILLHHPDTTDLAFLYGTILIDDNDGQETPTSNICVFGGKQIDRSPTGSGVTARIALMYKKKQLSLMQERTFKSITGLTFTGKAVKETKCGEHSAVIVEVKGMAYYTGKHTFMLEKEDPLSTGFQLSS